MFQPARPRGTRRLSRGRLGSTPDFNPRVREGRDIDRNRHQNQRQVSTRASARDATPTYYGCSAFWLRFNPRVREGRDFAQPERARLVRGFNPRVREGRDLESNTLKHGNLIVSTRASARDATIRQLPCLRHCRFQPARPRGTRLCGGVCPRQRRAVSTRASTRDATSLLVGYSSALHTFQPARPRGTRRLCTRARPHPCAFQPARPRGTRQHRRHDRFQQVPVSTRASARDATVFCPHADPGTRGFNPRVREGRDDSINERQLGFSVSTRASARDATSSAELIRPRREFQPARPRGTRRFQQRSILYPMMFQPARPRGTRRQFCA